MKKKVLFFVAVIALTILGIVTTIKTSSAVRLYPCPNGCVGGDGGCECGDYYPHYDEANIN